MGSILYAWRGELVGAAVWLATWLVFWLVLKRPFWRYWFPAMLLGISTEVSTEPEWTYSLQWYVWRDVSPIVIAGWGVIFAWLITLSNRVDAWLFGPPAANPDALRWRRMLTDVLVGMPLLLGNELFGLHILKVWKYNSILHWDTLIPGLNYPWEGLAAMLFWVIALPAVVRYWEKESNT